MGYNPSLVLVQPRKTHPYITERLLMGHKESNQAKWDSLAMNDNGTIFSLVVWPFIRDCHGIVYPTDPLYVNI